MNQENKNVTPLPHVEIERLAQETVGVTPYKAPEAHDTVIERQSKKFNMRKVLGGVGVVAASAFLFLPRPEQAPTQPDKTLLEHAEIAARIPVSIEDESVITTVKVKTNSSSQSTPGAAVLKNSEISEYIVKNPDEAATIETSANSLPSLTGEIVLAEKDLDSDGDKDTFVAPLEKE